MVMEPGQPPVRQSRTGDLAALYEMGGGDAEPERRPFLDSLVAFNKERGQGMSSVPTISKQPLDLYRLYASVKERGGFKEVSRTKAWKECANICNIAISSSAAYTLKKQYIKLLLAFECKYDRNDIPVEQLIAQTEAVSRKSKGKAGAPSPGPGDSNSQGSYPQSGTPSSSEHGPSNSYPPPSPLAAGGYPPPSPQQPGGYPPQSPATANAYPPGHPGHQGVGPGGSPYPPGPPASGGMPYPPGPGGYPGQPGSAAFNGGYRMGYPPPHHPGVAGHPGHGWPPGPGQMPPGHGHHGGHPMGPGGPPGMPNNVNASSGAQNSSGSGASATAASSSGESVSAQDPFSDAMQSAPNAYGHPSQHPRLPPGQPQQGAQRDPNSQPGGPPPGPGQPGGPPSSAGQYQQHGGYPNSSSGYYNSVSSHPSAHQQQPPPHAQPGQPPSSQGPPSQQQQAGPPPPGTPGSGPPQSTPASGSHSSSYQQHGYPNASAAGGYYNNAGQHPHGPPPHQGPGGPQGPGSNVPPSQQAGQGGPSNSQPGPPPTSSAHAPGGYPQHYATSTAGNYYNQSSQHPGHGAPPHGMQHAAERGQYPGAEQRQGMTPGDYPGRGGMPGGPGAPSHHQQQPGHYPGAPGNGYPQSPYGRPPGAPPSQVNAYGQQQRYGDYRDGRPPYEHHGRPEMSPYGQQSQQGPAPQPPQSGASGAPPPPGPPGPASQQRASYEHPSRGDAPMPYGPGGPASERRPSPSPSPNSRPDSVGSTGTAPSPYGALPPSKRHQDFGKESSESSSPYGPPSNYRQSAPPPQGPPESQYGPGPGGYPPRQPPSQATPPNTNSLLISHLNGDTRSFPPGYPSGGQPAGPNGPSSAPYPNYQAKQGPPPLRDTPDAPTARPDVPSQAPSPAGPGAPPPGARGPSPNSRESPGQPGAPSPYGTPIKRHPDFMKDQQPYPGGYGPQGPPTSQYPGHYPPGGPGAAPPSQRQPSQPGPGSTVHWNGESRGYPPGYVSQAGPNGVPSSPSTPYNNYNSTSGHPQRESWDMNSRPDAAGRPGFNRYGYPPGTTASAHPYQGASGEYYSGYGAGGQMKMGQHHPYPPKAGPGEMGARGMYGPPPMTPGSLAAQSKAGPTALPPHLHGPNRGQVPPTSSASPYPQPPPLQQPGQAPPSQMMQHMAAYAQPPKKEIVFPPNSVEATQPTFSKKRRLTAKDVSQIEAWRLLMCLKSGMLAESTWALDVLSVLVHDDSTVMCFVLQRRPGLLETLLEHYKKYLSEIFEDIFGDLEPNRLEDLEDDEKNCLTRFKVRRKSKRKQKWYEIDKDLEKSDVPVCDSKDEEVDKVLIDPTQLIPSEVASVTKLNHLLDIPSLKSGLDNQLVLLNGAINFTHQSRDGKPVKVGILNNGLNDEAKCLEFLSEGHTSDSGFHEEDDETSHILTQFDSKEKFVRFVRVLKDKSSAANVVDGSCTKEVEDVKPTLKVNGEVVTEIKNCTKEIKTEVVDEPMEVETSKVDEEDKDYPSFRSPKRKHALLDELDEEAFHKDDPPLCAVDDYSDALARRCLCLSTLIRNLSFVPGNELDMAKNQGLMHVLSRLLLLNHEHRSKKARLSDKKILKSLEEDSLFAGDDTTDVVDDNNNSDEVRDDDDDLFDKGEREWYWDAVHLILENSLVILANISGQLDLSAFPEDISLPLLDGLLHWAVCPSSYAQDHLPTTSLTSLSPQRLAQEALVKFSILDANVDLILATPPWDRLDRLFKQLAKQLSRNEDQTLREFALVLLVNLAGADTGIARAIALTGNAIPQLIAFVEQSEQSAMSIANSQGLNALRENPELMGTTLDMVRRSACCLRFLAKIPENRPLFMNFQQRLLALVMSQILDQGVAAIIADVIYECSLSDPTTSLSSTPFFPNINIKAILEAKELEKKEKEDKDEADEKENEDKDDKEDENEVHENNIDHSSEHEINKLSKANDDEDTIESVASLKNEVLRVHDSLAQNSTKAQNFPNLTGILSL